MIIVTGGCGFIGSNIVKHLNDRGIKDILVVDNLTNGHKFINLTDLDIADYMDKEDFLQLVLDEKKFDAKYGCKNIGAIFHEGACSSTTEWDGKYIMKNNYEYTVNLFEFAVAHRIPFFFASSANRRNTSPGRHGFLYLGTLVGGSLAKTTPPSSIARIV